MPIYNLKPVVAMLEEPAWTSSRGRGECWANGADEADARALASGHFQDARQTVPGQAAPLSPWLDPRLVKAIFCEQAPDNMSIPVGTVVFTNQS